MASDKSYSLLLDGNGAAVIILYPTPQGDRPRTGPFHASALAFINHRSLRWSAGCI